jgi:NAD(P)-dependent dehydrogenase (short-subunit alcohol dehydrogenase family)
MVFRATAPFLRVNAGSSRRPQMTDSNTFEGKLALVTGASRGIGAATAEALAAAGSHVILVARTASALEEIEERIHAAGGSATIAPLDLTEGDSIGKLAGAVAERWQKLDVLVLNAAMLGSLSPVQDIDAKEFSRILSLNLLANQAMIAAFDPLLRKAEKADVVALTSSVGAEPRAFWGAYGSSKAAVETLLGAYADETAYTGRIRVHIVDPGATRTRMRALAFPGEEPESVKPPEVVAAAILERLGNDVSTGQKMRVDA